jgi:DNA-binding NtrC family response regulator
VGSPEETGGRETRRKVLLVDDEHTARFSLGRYLTLLGFQVDAVASQGEADGLIDRRSYDVVITDLRLSGSDGTEGLDIIAHVRRCQPAATVILLTAYGTPDVLRAARDLGVTSILSKPVSLEAVLEAVSATGR